MSQVRKIQLGETGSDVKYLMDLQVYVFNQRSSSMDMKRKILTESMMCVHLCMNKQSDCSVFANIFRHIFENMNNLPFSCVDLLIENKVELLFVHLFLYTFVHVAFRPT